MSRKVLIVAFFLSATLNSIQGQGCEDSSHYAAQCQGWAANGECTKSHGFMNQFCKKSCNACPIARKLVHDSSHSYTQEENTASDCAATYKKSGETYCVIPFKSQKISFNEAKELCMSNNAALPVILNEEDQKNMYEIRGSTVGRKPIWLGGMFLKDSFKWINEDQTPLHHGFQNWHHGQPNKYFGSSLNCMTLHYKGKWNGESCDSKNAVICEKCLTCDDTTSATPTTAAPTTAAPTTAAPTTAAPTTAAPTTITSQGEGSLDPHAKGKQCVDVSSHTFPTWMQKDKKCCKTVFKKNIYQRSANVCNDVTALHCDVVPYTECEQKLYEEEVTTSHWSFENKPAYACVKSQVEIVHKKQKPVCTKKPKQVCNSKWEISPSGEKVWAGNEGCRTIYVDDCKLQEVPEVIKVEKPICTDSDKVPFITIIPKKEIKAVYKMECKVLKKTDCQAHTTKECATIEYTESEEKPHKNCDLANVHVPTTQLVHKKKCLLDHETFKQ